MLLPPTATPQYQGQLEMAEHTGVRVFTRPLEPEENPRAVDYAGPAPPVSGPRLGLPGDSAALSLSPAGMGRDAEDHRQCCGWTEVSAAAELGREHLPVSPKKGTSTQKFLETLQYKPLACHPNLPGPPSHPPHPHPQASVWG